MNEQQKQKLRTWLVEQDTSDTNKLLKMLTKRPVTYNDWQEIVDRDKLVVQTEKMLKVIAAEYSITLSTTPAQANDIFLSAFQAAPNDMQRFKAIDDKHMFWICYLAMQTLDVSGDNTKIIQHHDPIYGLSPAQEIELGEVTGDDIETILREI